MNDTTRSLDDLVKSAKQTVRLPKSALAIYDLANSDDSSLDDLTLAIEADPAFAAQILRLSNSAVYARGNEVSEVATAVRRIGRSEIGQLAFMLAFGPTVSKLENELMAATSFWKHSLTTGLLARDISKHLLMKPDAVFCAGLLHDIGLLILFAILPADMMAILERSLDLDEAHFISEQARLGYDHTVVGQAMAKEWNLPAPITEAIRCHHTPSEAQEFPKVSAVVALANALSNSRLNDDGETLSGSKLMEDIRAILGDGIDGLDHGWLLTKAEAQTDDMLRMI